MDENVKPCHYVWFDLEFTDLDPGKAQILQVAALATDVHLTPLQEGDRGLNICVKVPDDAYISAWVRENLVDLLAHCRSHEAVAPADVELLLIEYVDRVAGPPAEDIKQRPILAGNSLHMDWRLASTHYPRFIERLHYRHVDVSTLKLQWEEWLGKPGIDKESQALIEAYLPFDPGPLAGKPHDAYYDILASIAELQYYRQEMLIRP